MEYQYSIFNVFSDEGISGGNQLAVLPDAAGLSDAEMQTIAHEFNFSETTFVTRVGDADADVRIFTPAKEIDYAGHPTIGTLFALERLHRRGGDPRKRYDLVLQRGRVQGEFTGDGATPDRVSFKQLVADDRGTFSDRSGLLDLLGISESDVEGPLVMAGVTSMNFLFIRLKSADAVDALQPDLLGLSEGVYLADDISIYPFSFSEGVARARYFVPLYGISEDPATGGIQSSFGLCLKQHGLLSEGSNEVLVQQGDAMGSPSRIYDEFITDGDDLITKTGGRSYTFSDGVFWI